MKYVLDVSVAICWVIPRPLWPYAVKLRDEYLRQIHELLAPAVFIDEAAGALTKAERQKDIAVGDAAPLFAKIMNSPPVLIPHARLISRAIEISSRTRSGYYDCLYVALAEREGCELITADQKSINNLAPPFPLHRATGGATVNHRIIAARHRVPRCRKWRRSRPIAW
jgi:predicted nucleic acid-binding protein